LFYYRNPLEFHFSIFTKSIKLKNISIFANSKNSKQGKHFQQQTNNANVYLFCHHWHTQPWSRSEKTKRTIGQQLLQALKQWPDVEKMSRCDGDGPLTKKTINLTNSHRQLPHLQYLFWFQMHTYNQTSLYRNYIFCVYVLRIYII